MHGNCGFRTAWWMIGIVAIASVAFANAQDLSVSDGANESKVGSPPTAPSSVFQQRNPRYRLRKGDTFVLEFAFSPEFNQVIPIQPDGYVTLKSVGTIFVEGEN